jgi:hypothetical protein
MCVSKIKTKKNGGFMPENIVSTYRKKLRSLKPKQRKDQLYNYAKKLREYGVEVDTKARTFVLDADEIDQVPVGARYYVRLLIYHGFTKQLSLF